MVIVGDVSTTLTSFINNQSNQPMPYIKHEAKVSRKAIEEMVQELENPQVALLNKRISEVNQITDAAEIVRIHNGLVEAIESLHARVSAIEAKINS